MDDRYTVEDLRRLFEAELFSYVLPFWAQNSPDPKYGGIYNCLDSAGNVYSTDKSVWAQGRTAWIFSHLANLYPNHGDRDKWLAIAGNCVDFMNRYCIDKTDGRMYFTVTEDGLPLRKRRYFFSETFYIIGCAEYALAAGDSKALENAVKYYDFVWGIYEDPGRDPYKITPKTIDTTRAVKPFANPMILLNVTGVMRRCDNTNAGLYSDRAKTLVYHMQDFIKPGLKAVLESVGIDGAVHDKYSAGRIVNPGHAIEASWFLYSHASDYGDEQLKRMAYDIFNWSLERGWDSEYGGILYYTDVSGCPPEQYEHDMKLWWPHCEALIASLMLYLETKEERCFDWFKRITAYAFDKFSDHDSGDWYGYLRRDGTPTMPACKGSTYKSGFHLIRMLCMVIGMLEQLENKK